MNYNCWKMFPDIYKCQLATLVLWSRVTNCLLQLNTADYSWLQLITVNITAENGSLRSICIMYQHSFCELGLKLAVNRSEQKRDDKQRTNNQPTNNPNLVQSQPPAWLGWTSAGLGCRWAGLGWTGLGCSWAGLGWAKQQLASYIWKIQIYFI